MKKVTYPQEHLLGRAQFSLQKRFFQLLSKKTHGLWGRVFVRKINPTYNDRIIHHAFGSCMVYPFFLLHVSSKSPKIILFTPPPRQQKPQQHATNRKTQTSDQKIDI